jgi:protein arginine N-methyltransferase 1
MSMIEFHRKLLGDGIRNRAFHEALRRVVIPGKSTVADIGAGTGFLSFLAAKLGAKRCFLYEEGEVLRLAQGLAKANGIRHCTFIRKHSHDVRAPVRADIVLSETLGNFAYEEHIIENMEDAKRSVKDGGVLIPGKLTQLILPVTSERLWREVNVWDAVGFGIDFRAAKDVGLQNMYVKPIRSTDLLPKAEARSWDSIDFRRKNGSLRRGEARWSFRKPATVYGFALWWECELIPGVTLSTSPFAPPTHWEQIYLPVLSPVTLSAGGTVRIAIASDTRHRTGVNVTWDVEAANARGKIVERQHCDMRRGFIP